MEIAECTVIVDTTGEDASATGSQISKAMNGFLLDIRLDYHGDAPATTDVTVTRLETGDTILTVTDSKTDALIAPRQKMVDNANSAITNSHAMFPLNGCLQFAVAGCDALTTALTAKVRYLRMG